MIFFIALAGVSATSVSAESVFADRLKAFFSGQGSATQAAVTLANHDTSQPVEATDAEQVIDVTYNRAFISEIPVASGGPEWQCLSEALYFEARGESVRGMFAVGEVILNRVDSTAYPDTICDVVHQGTGRKYACQFTYTCDGLPENIREPRAWDRVGKVARLLIDGAERSLTAGATHYHTRAVNPSWAKRFPRTAAIDSHYFYRQPVRTASN